MTKTEVAAMRVSEEIVADMLERRNRSTEDCVLTSDIANEIGMRAPDLNSFLIDQKIMERKNHQLKLTQKYEDKGLTKNRSQFKYNSRGELKEVVYPVWMSRHEYGADQAETIMEKHGFKDWKDGEYSLSMGYLASWMQRMCQ